MTRAAWTVCAAIAALLAALPAGAQTPGEGEVFPAGDAVPAGIPLLLPERSGFELRLGTGVGFNSNVEEVPAGGTGTLGVGPAAFLVWQHRPVGFPLRLVAQAGVEGSRYMRARGGESDRAILALRLNFEQEPGQVLRPFLGYTQRHQYNTSFSHYDSTRHDFDAGLSVTLPLDSAPGWTVQIDTTLQRRLPNVGAFSTAVGLHLGLLHRWSQHWNIGAELGLGRRWYDRRGGPGAREWIFSPALTLEFTLPEAWLARAVPARVRLRVGFHRTTSSRVGSSYEQWGAGPSLHTSWPF